MGSTHNTPEQAQILVIDRNARRYKDALQADFPHARFHIAATEAEALPNIAACEVLIAFGTSISADLLGKAGSLRWIQALSAGTESIVRRPELSEDVLITSGNGIHGPQLSEMGAYHWQKTQFPALTCQGGLLCSRPKEHHQTSYLD